MVMPYHTYTLFICAISCTVITVLGTIGNLMAVVSLLRSPRLRRSSTYYIVNLALSNLPMCIVAMPTASVWFIQIIAYEKLKASHEMVRGIMIMGFICNQAELQTICVLGFNRVLAMTHPRFYRKLVQMKVHIWVLSGVWIYSIMFWLPLATGLVGDLEVKSDILFVHIGQEGTAVRRVYLVIGFMLPILFSLICHIVLLYKGIGLGGNSDVASRQQWRHHVTKTVCLVFSLLLLLSVPHAIVHALHHTHVDMPDAWLLIHMLFFSRYILDPAVFVWISSEYRRAFSETLSLLFPRVWSPPTILPPSLRGIDPPPCTPASTPRHKVIDLSALDLSKLANDTKKGFRFSKNRRVPTESKEPEVTTSLTRNKQYNDVTV